MNKIAFTLLGCIFYSFAIAQDTTLLVPITPPEETVIRKVKFPNRPGDHFMFQLSSDHWSGMPDSISSHQQGFSRGFNAYFMLDKPFRSSPKFSLGIGVGISTSNIFFQNMKVDLNSNYPILPFIALDSTDHFKKYKLATTYAEVPLEFRYTSDPANINRSLKIALGIKIGTLLNAHTKGKGFEDKNNKLINSYTQKISSKRYLNSTRFMATARVGYGIVSLFGAYQINHIIKDGLGPDMNLYQVGLTISGL